jgi:dihydroorotase-like cyclic amidohydrolase
MEAEVFCLEWQLVNQAEKGQLSFQTFVTKVSINPARLGATPRKTAQAVS